MVTNIAPPTVNNEALVSNHFPSTKTLKFLTQCEKMNNEISRNVTLQLDCVDALHTEYIQLLSNCVFYDCRYHWPYRFSFACSPERVEMHYKTNLPFCRYVMINCTSHTHTHTHTHVYVYI